MFYVKIYTTNRIKSIKLDTFGLLKERINENMEQ